ncbi:hypothetical protein [Couchioplanes azureus]|uniref:hypothetical protein n=1 Tax=Couchioplanes caeruleus TaxID=56438 RepID=UPI0016715A05|nr:hypothetical protein [Couchioplanes caeruleus]GGQ88231.1 hypothetical protein GCM10010166_67800 [Couchioplanes caeruleus subsp. azureus]
MSGANQREVQAGLKNRFAGLLGATAPAVEPAKTAPPPRKASRRKPAETPPPPPPAVTKNETAHPAKTTPAEPDLPPMPTTQASDDSGRTKRLMVPLYPDEDLALKEYRIKDGIAAAARVRAMLQLYRTDERFRKKVDQTARDMRTH